jgi:hypothetical protein
VGRAQVGKTKAAATKKQSGQSGDEKIRQNFELDEKIFTFYIQRQFNKYKNNEK